MKNQFKKVLSLLTALVLLISCCGLALAEEETTVVESEPVQTEEAVQETAPAQEEAPAEEPVQENIIVEETPVQEVPAVEEAPAAEEEVPAAEPETDPVPSYNNEEAPAEEEAPAQEAAAEEEAPSEEEAPAQEEVPAEEEAPASDEDPFAGEDDEEEESYNEDELMTIDDDEWGYVDPEIIPDYIPEITTEMKFPEMEELKLGEKVGGSIDAENDAQYVIKTESNKTIVLGLVASSENISMKINNKAVKFVENEETAVYDASYTMNMVAGQEYIITLTSSSPVNYKLTAEEAKAEVIEVAEEETTEENEETEATEEVKETEEDEKADEVEENEETEETEEVEETEESEEKEEAEETEETVEENIENDSEEEGIEDNGNEDSTDVNTNEEETVPAMVGWIVADADAYPVGGTAILTATSEVDLENQVVWQAKTEDGEWATAGYGNILTVELTEENAKNVYRFRMADGNFSEEIQLAVDVAEVEETAEEEIAEEQTEVEEETEINGESTEIVLPDDYSVTFTVEWENEVPAFGETAHMKAVVVGLDEYVYTYQWQWSIDNASWVDFEDETEETMDLLVDEDTIALYYRVNAIIVGRRDKD